MSWEDLDVQKAFFMFLFQLFFPQQHFWFKAFKVAPSALCDRDTWASGAQAESWMLRLPQNPLEIPLCLQDFRETAPNSQLEQLEQL